MPRLEALPKDDETERIAQLWYNKGNGSSTFDLCWKCANCYSDQELPIKTKRGRNMDVYNGEPEGTYYLLLDNGGCEHPYYADEELPCEVCGKLLGLEDD